MGNIFRLCKELGQKRALSHIQFKATYWEGGISAVFPRLLDWIQVPGPSYGNRNV